MKFLIDSPKLEALRLDEVSDYLKESLAKGCNPIIRHHNDCDGYASGIAVEKALVGFMTKHGMNSRLKRLATRTPYYDYIDAQRDLNFLPKDPLLIILDHGSTTESILAYQKLRMYGAKIVVIDHHNPTMRDGRPVVLDLISHLINPHLHGSDSNICTGMICTELARMLDEKIKGIDHFPALAGTADKCQGSEVEQYIKVSGHTKESLEQWAQVIDFEAFFVRGDGASNIILDLFDERGRKDDIIEQDTKEIERRFEMLRPAISKYSRKKLIGSITHTEIDVDKFMSWGSYPNFSKVTSRVNKEAPQPRITLGLLSDSIAFRCDGIPRFDLHSLIENLKNEFPHALIDGGGHICAGTIRFSPGAREEVLSFIKKYLDGLERQ